MSVLHGTGKPRLVYRDPSTSVAIGTITKVGSGFIKVDSTPPSGIENMGIFSVNYNSEETWARIKSVDVSNKLIYHTVFSNGEPEKNNIATYKYKVYDLPYCQNNLIESFEPDFIQHKLDGGKVYTIRRGWWYSAVLDYSRRVTSEQFSYFEDLFNLSREYDIYFYPRLDNLDIGYKVELDPSTPILLAQKPFHRANKLLKIKLNGIERLSAIPVTPGYKLLATEDGSVIATEDDIYIGVNQ